MKNIKFFFFIILMLLILNSCMAGTGKSTPDDRAGFILGIWHGWIAPIALIGSIFNSDIKIYEVNNIGFWYELGFYIAIISGFGSISLIRKKNS